MRLDNIPLLFYLKNDRLKEIETWLCRNFYFFSFIILKSIFETIEKANMFF